MSRVISYLQNSNHVEESEDKCFVCVVDNIVVGNIIKCKMSLDNNVVPVILPDWQTLLKILQSPNHQFVERSIPIFPGTIWNGQDFIAPTEPEDASVTQSIICKKVQNSYIYYSDNTWIAIKEYTMYIIELLEDYLNKNPLSINLFVNINNSIETNNENRIVKIGINYEQTIVADEISASSTEPQGKIECNGKQYTVNVDMINDFKGNDIIFDYSKPNIKNIEISGLYPELLPKFQYISPSVYHSVTTSTNQKTNIITLFLSETPRRQTIITELSQLDNYINRNDCYDKELFDLLINSKMLINIHRSDDENTFEELRVLPALMNRVLVISEISPLTELIPYNPLIIWATYENIVEKTKEVLEHYDEYVSKIFTSENINILNHLNDLNKMNISKMLQ